MSIARVTSWLVITSLLNCVVLAGRHGVADEPSDGISSEMAERWRSVLDEISTSFQITRNGVTLTDLHKLSVLNIWNPTSLPNPRLGRVYLWTEQGRPVAIASIFTGAGLGFREAVNIIYEFHSLDSKPIHIKGRKVMLDCPTGGIQWLPVEDGQPPKPSRVLRMIQMRNLARSFEVSGTTLENDISKFTLFPSPIYRYENETSLATDGAIFAIGRDSDPNVYLLIEARNDQWWVAFARSTVITVRIERNDQLFYKFDKIDKISEKRTGTPFYIDWIGERRNASSPETGSTSK